MMYTCCMSCILTMVMLIELPDGTLKGSDGNIVIEVGFRIVMNELPIGRRKELD